MLLLPELCTGDRAQKPRKRLKNRNKDYIYRYAS